MAKFDTSSMNRMYPNPCTCWIKIIFIKIFPKSHYFDIIYFFQSHIMNSSEVNETECTPDNTY